MKQVGKEDFLIACAAKAHSDLANVYAKVKDKNNTIVNMKKLLKNICTWIALQITETVFINLRCLKVFLTKAIPFNSDCTFQ